MRTPKKPANHDQLADPVNDEIREDADANDQNAIETQDQKESDADDEIDIDPISPSDNDSAEDEEADADEETDADDEAGSTGDAESHEKGNIESDGLVEVRFTFNYYDDVLYQAGQSYRVTPEKLAEFKKRKVL